MTRAARTGEAGAGLVALATFSAHAQSPAAFYATHSLPVLIGTSAGDACDTCGRLVARHLGKPMPGNPLIVSQNLPGAGGLAAASFHCNNAPEDDFDVSIFSRSIPLQPIVDAAGARFDAMEREMIIGASAAGADSAIVAFVQNNLIGTKFKVVNGYPGAADYFLAIARGELDGGASSSWSNFTGPRAVWLSGKKINILLQLAWDGRPDVDAPVVTQHAKIKLDRKVPAMVFFRQILACPCAAPPNVVARAKAVIEQGAMPTRKQKKQAVRFVKPHTACYHRCNDITGRAT